MAIYRGIAYYDNGFLSDAIALIPLYVDGIISQYHFPTKRKLVSFGVNLKRLKTFTRDVREIVRRIQRELPNHRRILQNFLDLHNESPMKLRQAMNVDSRGADFLRVILEEGLVGAVGKQLYTGSLTKKNTKELMEIATKHGAVYEHSFLVKYVKGSEEGIKKAFGNLGKAFSIVKIVQGSEKNKSKNRVFDYENGIFVQEPKSSAVQNQFLISFCAEQDPKYLKELEIKADQKNIYLPFRLMEPIIYQQAAFVSLFARNKIFTINQSIPSTNRSREKKNSKLRNSQIQSGVDELVNGDVITLKGRPLSIHYIAPLESKNIGIEFSCLDHVCPRKDAPNNTFLYVPGRIMHVKKTALLSCLTAIPEGRGLLALLLLVHYQAEAPDQTLQYFKEQKEEMKNQVDQEEREKSKVPELRWIKGISTPYLSGKFTLEPMVREDILTSDLFVSFQQLLLSVSDLNSDPFAPPNLEFHELTLSKVLGSMHLRYTLPDGTIKIVSHGTEYREDDLLQIPDDDTWKLVSYTQSKLKNKSSVEGPILPSTNVAQIEKDADLMKFQDLFRSETLRGSRTIIYHACAKRVKQKMNLKDRDFTKFIQDSGGIDNMIKEYATLDRTTAGLIIRPHPSHFCPTPTCLQVFGTWARCQTHMQIAKHFHLNRSWLKQECSIKHYPEDQRSKLDQNYCTVKPTLPSPFHNHPFCCPTCAMTFAKWMNCRSHLEQTGHYNTQGKTKRELKLIMKNTLSSVQGTSPTSPATSVTVPITSFASLATVKPSCPTAVRPWNVTSDNTVNPPLPSSTYTTTEKSSPPTAVRPWNVTSDNTVNPPLPSSAYTTTEKPSPYATNSWLVLHSGNTVHPSLTEVKPWDVAPSGNTVNPSAPSTVTLPENSTPSVTVQRDIRMKFRCPEQSCNKFFLSWGKCRKHVDDTGHYIIVLGSPESKKKAQELMKISKHPVWNISTTTKTTSTTTYSPTTNTPATTTTIPRQPITTLTYTTATSTTSTTFSKTTTLVSMVPLSVGNTTTTTIPNTSVPISTASAPTTTTTDHKPDLVSPILDLNEKTTTEHQLWVETRQMQAREQHYNQELKVCQADIEHLRKDLQILDKIYALTNKSELEIKKLQTREEEREKKMEEDGKNQEKQFQEMIESFETKMTQQVQITLEKQHEKTIQQLQQQLAIQQLAMQQYVDQQKFQEKVVEQLQKQLEKQEQVFQKQLEKQEQVLQKQLEKQEQVFQKQLEKQEQMQNQIQEQQNIQNQNKMEMKQLQQQLALQQRTIQQLQIQLTQSQPSLSRLLQFSQPQPQPQPPPKFTQHSRWQEKN
eukprot:TRINITY_DN11800_c0_g1_i2.p1 TRINITY_DN11800_c0_g1~~TRINITY_DN11800_c0_g1_i2.p1  ORF type:complete len:1497 (+),score=274.10 TRINITY_DN11800_c0_g1_i2:562-4491(+)